MTTHNQHARAAITARYVGPTNTKPSRISVKTQRGNGIFTYNQGFSGTNAFNCAVAQMLARFVEQDRKEYGPNATGWGTLAGYSVGQCPDGTYVYVCNT
jgi:hypothetical protein